MLFKGKTNLTKVPNHTKKKKKTMRVYRKTTGITVQLRRALEKDILALEIQHPNDRLLPAMSAMESCALIIGDNRDKTPSGFIEYFVRDGELVITGLWVEPDNRGKGYGAMMLNLVEENEQPKITRVIVTPSSKGFYSKQGYSPDQGINVMTKVCGYSNV